MSSTTSRLGLRYPSSGDNANPPLDFQNLASDVDSKVPGYTTADSTSAPAAPYVGQFWYKTDTATLLFYNGTSWLPVGTPTGTIIDFAGATVPTGYVWCDGSSYATSGRYLDLYNAIGTTWGSGSGTFKVPNLKGRVLVGSDPTGAVLTSSGYVASPATVGTAGGEQNHLILSGEAGVANHKHTDSGHSHGIASVAEYGSFGAFNSYSMAGGTVANDTFNSNSSNANISYTSANASSAHNNMQPYSVATKIIKL